MFVLYLDKINGILPKLKDHSAIRQAAKIGMFLAKSNHRKNAIELSKDREQKLLKI